MTIPELNIRSEDETVIALKDLYRQYGYKPYKMSRFESYELYAENKNFLVSDNVITFTDMTGKLMALRPDVTLSIIKNYKPSDGTQKLFYRENVYRTVKNVNDIREILQVGLECVGDVGLYETCEVLLLAARSLESISEHYIIDISHMGFISGLLSYAKADDKAASDIISCVKCKNTHDIYRICESSGISAEASEKLSEAASLWGSFESVLPVLKNISCCEDTDRAVSELEDIYRQLRAAGCADRFRIDMSVIHDIDYYDRIVFSGFIEGIPVNVLSGGRYDRLLERFRKRSNAVGFAVYLGLIEQYAPGNSEDSAETVIYYDDDSDTERLTRAVGDFTRDNRSISVRRLGKDEKTPDICEEVSGGGIYYINGRELERLC